MKRILALFLCLVMCLSLIPAACAEDIEIIDVIDVGEVEEAEEVEEAGELGDEALIAIVETETETGGEKLAAAPTITKQPASRTAYVDTTAKFAVQATGATSYQWQYRTSKTGSWKNSGLSSAKTATLSLKATSSLNGYQYRCAVKNASGTTYSYIVTLTVSTKPVITAQPSSKTAGVNETVQFAVKATGATSYQWQYRTSKTGSWHNSGLSSAKTATLSVKATDSVNGYQYRCAVKNASGTTYSYIVTLTIAKPVITKQPASQTVIVNDTAKFTVKATGATRYQWQYRTSKTGSWHNSGLTSAKTATLSLKATSSLSGYQYRCKVTNASGTTTSYIVTLTVIEKPLITTQPMSYTASIGANVYLKVKAVGAESYQWYYRKGSSGSWSKATLTGAATDTLTVKAAEEYNGYQYYCKVTNAYGSTGSAAATLTVPLRGGSYLYGDNIIWKLDSSGLLTISGTGDMENRQGTASVTYAGNPYRDQIKRVSIGSGITSVCDYAFCRCRLLTKVTIPASVTSIGVNAFSGCSLAEVTIPDAVSFIGYGAFSGCDSLTGITIPAGVTEIEDTVLASCDHLKSITVADGNKNYVSLNGVLFNKDKTQLIQYPAGKSGSYTIPSSVTQINDYAFNDCIGLTGVTIPTGVTFIGYRSFLGCTGLPEVTLPSSLKTISGGAFQNCSSLSKMTIPASVTDVQWGAFAGCTGLKSFTVASGNNHFVTADGVLFNKDKTELIQYPAGKTGAYTIPSSVTNIANMSFLGSVGLTEVTIPGSVKTISAYDFKDCKVLAKVTIPNSVTSIGWGAFDNCSALTSVTIPDSVTYIDNEVFKDCKALKTAVIGNGLQCLSPGLFQNCSALTSLTIGTGVNALSDHFEGCSSLTTVTIASGNNYLCSRSGVVYSKDKKTLILCPPGKTTCTIPSDVTTIDDYAFENCSRLTSVTIPTSVTEIGAAFTDCSSLTDVYYKGTKTQWEQISIQYFNDPLKNATIHYNA